MIPQTMDLTSHESLVLQRCYAGNQKHLCPKTSNPDGLPSNKPFSFPTSIFLQTHCSLIGPRKSWHLEQTSLHMYMAPQVSHRRHEAKSVSQIWASQLHHCGKMTSLFIRRDPVLGGPVLTQTLLPELQRSLVPIVKLNAKWLQFICNIYTKQYSKKNLLSKTS